MHVEKIAIVLRTYPDRQGPLLHARPDRGLHPGIAPDRELHQDTLAFVALAASATVFVHPDTQQH